MSSGPRRSAVTATFARASDSATTSFYDEMGRSGGSMIRVACVLGFLSFFGMAWVDPWLVTGPDLDHALDLRIVACGIFVALFGVTFLRDWTMRHVRILSQLACLVTELTVVGLAYFTGGGASTYHEALFIVMFGYAVMPVPWRRYDAPILYGMALVTYLVLLVALDRTGAWGTLITNMALISAAAIISVVFQQILMRGRFREFVQRAELAQANQRLTALDEAKSRFFANLSHELRTPLTLTLAPLEALLESTRAPLSDSQREKLVLAQRNALRLLRMVDDLLALTRAEASALSLSVGPVDVAKVVTALRDDIAELAARKNLRLTTQLDGDAIIEGDVHLVERVLLNLVGNATKFVGIGGSVTMSVRAQSSGVELMVADDGIGISEGDLPRIFDRFYQADSGSTRRTGGTGIGLALVREIMELHGGRVWAESAPALGTTVHCWFPRVLPPERAAAARRALPEAAGTAVGLPEWHDAIRRDRRYRLQGIDDATERRVAPRPQPQGPAPTVLVVEDNHDMIRFLVALLAYDFNVVTAQNGRDGLRLAMERRPDLIISDVMMPEMDGIELVEALRASSFTRHIPFIFLTARGEIDDRLAGRQGGADIYMTKPFKSEELLAAVDTLLARQTSMFAEMMSREDEVLVFMASGIVERMAPAREALAASREIVARGGQALAAGRFDLGLERLEALERSLDGFARIGADEVVDGADVDSTIRRVIDIVRRKDAAFGASDHVVLTDLQAARSVGLRPDELEAALLPLIERALSATPRERAVTITSHVGSDDSVTVRIEDEGPTLATPHMERLFFPYYLRATEDPDGLGLARARRIVTARDGHISVESRGLEGTRVVLHLPLRAGARP